MALTINTNSMALNIQRNLAHNQKLLATSMHRLSSGTRVNSAKDDAAGVAIAERINIQIRGMNVAMRNANDGISLAQSAEGGLQEISSMLQRMRELAIQSSNGTNSTSDRSNLDTEFQALNAEIGRIAQNTTFNGDAILNTSAVVSGGVTRDASVEFYVGPVADSANSLTISLKKIETLTVTSGGVSGLAAGIAGIPGAGNAITAIDIMIDDVTKARADFGAVQSRFQSTINNLQVGLENQSAARGRIMDADFAVESANLAKAQILRQAGNAMLSHANAAPQSVLSLLT
ncbi:MAG: flagellin [Granulosicoccus sp.]